MCFTVSTSAWRLVRAARLLWSPGFRFSHPQKTRLTLLRKPVRMNSCYTGPMDDKNLVELLARWQQGDRRAGDQVYRHLAPDIIGFFRNKARAEIDDLVQETFKRLASKQQEIHNPKGFALRIAQLVLFEHYRSRSKHGPFDPDVDSLARLDPGPSTIAARRREHRLLLTALRHLPVQDQIYIEQFYFAGEESQKIAEDFEVDPSTMRTRLANARKRLCNEIARLAESEPLARSTNDDLDRWAADIKKLLEHVAYAGGERSTAGLDTMMVDHGR